jgi:hypothetical protein
MGKHNIRLDHLSHIQTREASTNLDDEILDVQLFLVEVVPRELAEIEKFLITIQAPTKYTHAQHRQLVTQNVYY